MSETQTVEEIAEQYSAMQDSVNLINDGKPEGMSDEHWEEALAFNKAHLVVMLKADFWTGEDMVACITASK
jgi:hypothetical protein